VTRPEIIMTIKNRNVTIFECDAPDCKWSLLALGTAISGEREALEHLKTHDR
jgi:hypothetical protein